MHRADPATARSGRSQARSGSWRRVQTFHATEQTSQGSCLTVKPSPPKRVALDSGPVAVRCDNRGGQAAATATTWLRAPRSAAIPAGAEGVGAARHRRTTSDARLACPDQLASSAWRPEVVTVRAVVSSFGTGVLVEREVVRSSLAPAGNAADVLGLKGRACGRIERASRFGARLASGASGTLARDLKAATSDQTPRIRAAPHGRATWGTPSLGREWRPPGYAARAQPG